MPIRSASITVGSNAIALTSNSSVVVQGSVLVQNMGGTLPGIVYVGDSQVSASTGFILASNASQQFYVGGNGVLYGITQNPNQTVRVVEIV